MLNNSGITKTTGMAPVQILLNADLQMSVGVVVSKDAGVESGSKKIVKAGTPLTGDLDKRTTAFTKGTESAVGVLLHDVDVTSGNANGTLLIFGFVNTNRLEADTKAFITEAVKTSLNGKVTFIAE
jgi:hypothetical protein